MTLDVPNLRDFDARLRAEAAEEPALEVPRDPPSKKTQIIAIYGKGGIGKSFTLANLSHIMAEMGLRVLLIGCDPKSDTTSLLFGGKACPTIIETSTRKRLAGEEVRIGDVCFKRNGVFAMELGGPEVGRGCGGRGIIHGFELLEKLGFHDWDFDFVLLDFLGDVVCGGFGLPIARDMAQKVIIVGSNDLQSLYVANNVCSAVEYFRKLGGNVGVAGIVINKDDGTGEAAAFARAVNIPVLAAIPADEDLRRKSANYQIVGTRAGRWGPLFEELARNVAAAPPLRPKPLGQDALLGLFSAETTGAGFVLEPATDADMRGGRAAPRKSLEVVYDDV
jgi:chlorophyllide a reductase subunit X